MPEQTVIACVYVNSEEMFLLVTIDVEAGRLVSTSDPITEADMRTHLADGGVSAGGIESAITNAREQRKKRAPSG